MKKSLPKSLEKEDKGPKTDFDQKFLEAVDQAKRISGIKSDRAMSIELGRHTDFINRVRNGFQSTPADAWDALLSKYPESSSFSQNLNSGNAVGVNHGVSTQSQGTSSNLLAEAQLQAALDAALRENAMLREQLAMKDTVIATKDEMLALLRSSYTRPN